MANLRPKSRIKIKMQGRGETHARARIMVRDVEGIIDEPTERGGTNRGLTPTETLMASLIGCTNVIAKRIAHGMGIRMGEMTIALTATFDRRGTMLAEDVAHPFSDIVMDIEVQTDASPDLLAAVQRDLGRFCPVAKVLRGSGVTITENWTARPL